MNADAVVKDLRRRGLGNGASLGYHSGIADEAADLIESLRAQLAESQRRARDARNELCLKCGRYHEAHKGACDGCRWKKG